MRLQPHLIGIAGASCSGKSELARHLASALGASVVSLDAYYRDLRELRVDGRLRVNFDRPEAFDHALLYEQVQQLAAGRSIETPVYDFSTDSRLADTVHVPSAEYVIIEGLFALHWTDIRKLLRTKVFLSASHDVCIARRLARDVAERGRIPELVEQQYRETVRPMYEKFVARTKHFADVLLSGTESVDTSVAVLTEHLRNSPRLSTTRGRVLAVTA